MAAAATRRTTRPTGPTGPDPRTIDETVPRRPPAFAGPAVADAGAEGAVVMLGVLAKRERPASPSAEPTSTARHDRTSNPAWRRYPSSWPLDHSYWWNAPGVAAVAATRRRVTIRPPVG